MSEEQQDAIIGRTLKEYQCAKKTVAALYAEAERIGNNLTVAGHALRTNHNLSGDSFGRLDMESWPTKAQLETLATDITTARSEKKRLADHLKDAGFEQPE